MFRITKADVRKLKFDFQIRTKKMSWVRTSIKMNKSIFFSNLLKRIQINASKLQIYKKKIAWNLLKLMQKNCVISTFCGEKINIFFNKI